MKEDYLTGQFYKNHPTFFQEDSPWKVEKTVAVMKKTNLEVGQHGKCIVVEIGCGAGLCLLGFSLYLESLGKTVKAYGYDLSPGAIDIARTNYPDASFLMKEFEVGDFADVAIDFALLYDVLEHVEDPDTLVRDLSSRARYVVANIPLDDNLNLNLRDPENKGVQHTGHIHRFNSESALSLLDRNGYSVLGYELVSIDVDGPTKRQGIMATLGRPIKKVLYRIDRSLLAKIMGCSLIVVAKRVSL